MTNPTLYPQLKILEDSLSSAASTASSASSSTNSSGRRSGRIKKQATKFDMSVKSKPVTKFKEIRSVISKEWGRRPSLSRTTKAPTLIKSKEEESLFKVPSRRGSTASSIRARRDESEQRRDAKAEEIWQEGAASEEDDNRSILTRAASLEELETGSIVREGLETGSVLETGSGVSKSRLGGGVNIISMKVN